MAVVALNLLSVLLCVEVDDVTACRTLVAAARAHCRTSGCLAVINDMFTNRMMFHGTWRALCRCLSVACRECELNQSYCSHLIPVCVQKCSATNMDIYLVLLSLLFKHKGNIEVFLQSNGISLFTREFLHDEKCLLLLTVVVQTDEGLSMIRQTKVPEDLRDLLQLYGPRSEISQKALIILNHVDLRNNGLNYHISQNMKSQTQVQKKDNVNSINPEVVNEFDDTKTLLQNIMKEVFAYEQSEKRLLDKSVKMMQAVSSCTNDAAKDNKTKIPSNHFVLRMSRTRSGLRRKTNRDMKISFSNNSNVNSHKNYDLNRLRQDFRKHISIINNSNVVSKDNHDPNTFRKDLKKYTRNLTLRYNINVDKAKSNKVKSTMYFSKESKVGGSKNHGPNQQRKDFRNEMSIRKATQMFNSTEQTHTLNNIQRNTKAMFSKPSDDTMSEIDLQQSFKPKFSSTLKQEEHEMSDHKMDMFQSTMFSSYATNKLHSTQHGRVNKSKTKCVSKDKDIKNKSLSSRLFSAINESCTTFVKSVANIFTKKNTKNIHKDSLQSSFEVDDRSCSYSFLKYMQQRDVMMKDRFETNKDMSMFSMATQLCETCDNTAALKLKLEHNENLKETMKKLKLGINLYGCDFKKISRTMWPREPYMTPLALYNLYRKLIVK